MCTGCASTIDILIINGTGACMLEPWNFFKYANLWCCDMLKMEDEAGWMAKVQNIGSEIKEHLKVINLKAVNSSATNGKQILWRRRKITSCI